MARWILGLRRRLYRHIGAHPFPKRSGIPFLTSLAKAVDEEGDWEAALGGAAEQDASHPASEPRDWATRLLKLRFATLPPVVDAN